MGSFRDVHSGYERRFSSEDCSYKKWTENVHDEVLLWYVGCKCACGSVFVICSRQTMRMCIRKHFLHSLPPGAESGIATDRIRLAALRLNTPGAPQTPSKSCHHFERTESFRMLISVVWGPTLHLFLVARPSSYGLGTPLPQSGSRRRRWGGGGVGGNNTAWSR